VLYLDEPKKAESLVWNSISNDISILKSSGQKSLFSSPLWSEDGVPVWIVLAFQQLKERLIQENMDFDVWTKWYEERLVGAALDFDELNIRAGMEIDWLDKGPAAYNAELKRRLREAGKWTDDPSKADPSANDLPEARRDVFSPVDFNWNAEGQIAVTAIYGQIPSLPFPSSASDHHERLDLCRDLAMDLQVALEAQRFQVSPDYLIQIMRYAERLPGSPGVSGILRADAAIRNLRDLFEADALILSNGFAAALRGLMQAHLALRPFYPELERLYADVRNGRINEPLPVDAVHAITDIIRANTPRQFDPSVPEAMGIIAEPTVSPALPVINSGDIGPIQPPPDPLGPIENAKTKDAEQAGMLNRLWSVFKKGKEANESIDGWSDTASKLREPMHKLLDWINRNWPSGGDGMPPMQPPTTMV
jgi:hypothetical protein